MKDEIKEILEEINKIIDNTSYNEEFTYFQTSHISKLLDYITNLQERIEKAIPMLKELNIKLKDILKTGIDIKEISNIEKVLQGVGKDGDN